MAHEILLVRHGRPATRARGFMSHAGYRQWLQDYDRAGLHPDSRPSWALRRRLDGVETLWTSTLPRAVQSADQLLPGAQRAARSEFDEAPLPVPAVPGLWLRPAAWSSLARVLWLAGFNGGVEPHRRFEARLAGARDILTAAAEADGRAVLVAHGWLNWRLAKALKQAGWHLVHSETGRYWGLHHLVRPAAGEPAPGRAARLDPPPLGLPNAAGAALDKLGYRRLRALLADSW